MPAGRGLHRVRDTLVIVRLIVAVEIVETGDLIAAEDVDLSIDDLHPERLMQTGGKAFPAELFEFFIDAAHEPDLAGHRRDGGAAVFEEVVRGEEEDRAVGILEGDRQRVGGEGLLRSNRAFGLEPLRPLRGPALGHGSEFNRLVATRVEVMRLAVRLVGKDHLFAMPIKPEVTPLASFNRLRDDLALQRGSGHETVTRVIEPDKPTFPRHRESQRQRIEDRGEIIEANAHAFRQGEARAFEDTTKDVAEIAFSPASVFPGDLVVLVAPVALLTSVHAGKAGDQIRQRTMREKGDGLFAIVVEDPLAVHEGLPMAILRGVERLQGRLKGRRSRSPWAREKRIEMVEIPKAKGVVHALSRRIARPGFHDAAGEPHIIKDPVAPDPALDEATKGELLLLRRLQLTRLADGLFEHLLSIDPESDEFRIDARDEVMPLPIADIEAGIEITSTPGQIKGERAAPGVGVELPMRAGRFRIAGDEDIEAILARQFRAAFDRKRQRVEISVAIDDHSTSKRLAEFVTQGSDLGSFSERRPRPSGLRLRFGPGAVFRLRRRRRVVELRD